MSEFNSYIFENLTHLTDFNSSISLCIYKPSHKLFIVRKADASSKYYYDKISQLDNKNLSRILYIHKDNDILYVVREYLSGDSLDHILSRNEKLPTEQAVEIACEVCNGLASLHEHGMVHRDINPNNIIVTTDGCVKIIDYGIVRSFETDKSSDTVILGTPGYAAPEQFGFSQSDVKTDIYAVGVLLNVMLTGKMPNERLADGALGRIVKKCTAIDPQRRYTNISELKRAISSKKPNVGFTSSFLRSIPGLRSSSPLRCSLAFFGYFCILYLTYIFFSTLTPEIKNILIGICSYFFTAIIPFFCYHNFLDIYNKLPFTRGEDYKSQKAIYIALGTVSLLFGTIIFSNLSFIS